MRDKTSGSKEIDICFSLLGRECLLTATMTYWSEDWQYKPSGDGVTSLSTKKRDGYDYFNLANTKITGCPYSQGYVYGYRPDLTYGRAQVKSRETLMEISQIIEEMYKNSNYTGMDVKTKVGDLIFKFVIDLRYACDVFPNAKNFSEASAENVKKLKTRFKRLKTVPEGLVENLERVRDLVSKVDFS